MARLPLDVAYANAIRANRDRTERFVVAQFTRGEHRSKDVARFLNTVVPVVLASRRQASALTDSYLAQNLSRQLGRKVRPQGPIDTAALRGVPVVEVYRRPFVTVWTKLSEGMAYDAAVATGAARLGAMVLTDLQLAKTNTAQSVLSNSDGIVGYNRVPSGDKVCDLCLIASQNTYHVADLMPIHDRCNCGVEPIIRPTESTVREPSDSDVEIAVHHNSEVGPVLTVKGQEFTTVHDLAA